MATIENGNKKSWGWAALAFILIIFALYGVAKELVAPSKDGETKKIADQLSTLVDKMTATGKTLDNVEGSVKKLPSQMEEKILDHEKRMHSKPRQRAPKKGNVAQVSKPATPVVDMQKVISDAIDSCAKMGGVLHSKGSGQFECKYQPAQQTVAKVESQPAPVVERPAERPPVQVQVSSREGQQCSELDGVPAYWTRDGRCVLESSPPPRYHQRQPQREVVYYDDVPQQEPQADSGSSWVPWAVGIAAVLGIGSYLNNKKSTPAMMNPGGVGGPVNPLPGPAPVLP